MVKIGKEPTRSLRKDKNEERVAEIKRQRYARADAAKLTNPKTTQSTHGGVVRRT